MGFVMIKLSPPWILTGSEICFDPRNKHYLAFINISVSQGQRL